MLNVYLYIIIRKKNVFAGSLPKTSKTYLRRLRKTSLRRLTDVFARLLQDIFRKTSCNYVLKTSRKRKKCYTEDIFSTSSPRQMFAGNIRLILSFSTKKFFFFENITFFFLVKVIHSFFLEFKETICMIQFV